MAVYRYRAFKEFEDENVESGIVVASNEKKAKEKLKKHGFGATRLERMRGFQALFSARKADIR